MTANTIIVHPKTMQRARETSTKYRSSWDLQCPQCPPANGCRYDKQLDTPTTTTTTTCRKEQQQTKKKKHITESEQTRVRSKDDKLQGEQHDQGMKGRLRDDGIWVFEELLAAFTNSNRKPRRWRHAVSFSCTFLALAVSRVWLWSVHQGVTIFVSTLMISGCWRDR